MSSERHYGRWCEGCGIDHGPLYPCSKYPPEVLADIKLKSAKVAVNLADPDWVANQIANGVPTEVIEVFRFFMPPKP